MGIRFLHLADSHLGARHPSRQGGDPFAANLRAALAPARRGEIDLVLHAGDLFHRSRPPPRRVALACEMLAHAAEGGAEVAVVAGNHERSIHPCRLLLTHPRVHFLEAPSALRLAIDGADVAVFGFPFLRRDARRRFREVLRQAGWPRARAGLNLLLCHQTFDGATVGPADYTFRHGPDVVPRAFVPAELDYAALGHIHRHQHLDHPRTDRLRLSYPGSTERTSWAERFEPKGYLRGELGSPLEVDFVALPTVEIPQAAGPPRRIENWNPVRRGDR